MSLMLLVRILIMNPIWSLSLCIRRFHWGKLESPSDEEVVVTNTDQSDNSDIGLDALMSDLGIDNKDEEMPESSEEEEPEEE